jgi:hypothetical protein
MTLAPEMQKWQPVAVLSVLASLSPIVPLQAFNP